MGTNLATILAGSAERHGARTAIKLDDLELSYEQVNDLSARVAGLLGEKGIGPGDRVGIIKREIDVPETTRAR
jgi:long-chain acyl-CoA synthetase